MSTLLINTAMLLIAGFGCLVVGGLVLNNPPLDTAPGMTERLKTYLSTNVAETRRNHTFPELELPCYRLPPRTLFTHIEKSLAILGWQITDMDEKQWRIEAIVESALLKFKDDVTIVLKIEECGTAVYIRASSRVGRADLGANLRHILDLLNTMSRII